VVGAVQLEPLLDLGEGGHETGVVEDGRQVEQLRVRCQAGLPGVDQAEEEDPPGMVVDERAGRVPDQPGRLGDRRRLRNRQARDDLWHDLHAARRAGRAAALVRPRIT
jgi:hypothetical protein